MQWVLIIALSAVVLIVAFSIRSSHENNLIAEGKAIKRETAFWEKAEIFTTDTTYETVVSEIEKMDFSEIKADVYPNVNGQKAILWKSSHAWNSQLAYMGQKDGKQVYRFSFTGWRTRNGSPYRTDTMNIMMTSVEKLLLSLDPATTVETHTMQIKSKMKII